LRATLRAPADQAPERDEGREGDRADHQQRERDAEPERRYGGHGERRERRGDQPREWDRQPDEVLALVRDGEAR